MSSSKTAYTRARERAGSVLAVETRFRPHDNEDAKRAYAVARAAEVIDEVLGGGRYPPLTPEQVQSLAQQIRSYSTKKAGV